MPPSSHRAAIRAVIRRRRAVSFVLAATVVLGLLPAVGTAGAATSPFSIRLVRSAKTVTLDSWDGFVSLDLGVYVAAEGDDLHVRVRRPFGASVPIATLHDGEGDEVGILPAKLVDGWAGLKNFAEVTFTDGAGVVVARKRLTFCPNGWNQQRLAQTAVLNPTYPNGCGSFFPFTRGSVWGLDAGWATSISSENDMYSSGIDVAPGTYAVTVRITAPYATLWNIPSNGRVVRLTAVVREGEFYEEPWSRSVAVLSAQAGSTPPAAGASIAAPGTNGRLPDLVALPAWSLWTEREGGRDLLSFAATPWNSGPGPFVIEGFRRSGRNVMDAWQYLYDEHGQAQERFRVGTMQYHAGGGHDHWHFLQFAAFDLLGASGSKPVRSQKQGFCLAPTDAVDLTVTGAVMQPYGGTTSMCGGSTAMWVREVLQAGWGDTYFNVSGQAFDITDLPNGTYRVRVRVDPLGVVKQRRTNNDVAYREVTLGGRPGRRTVTAAPWKGISEGSTLPMQ